MTEYIAEEMRMINQMLLGIFIAADFGYFLLLNHSSFPWLPFAGAALGLLIIVICWTGFKYWMFTLSLLLSTFVFSIAYTIFW